MNQSIFELIKIDLHTLGYIVCARSQPHYNILTPATHLVDASTE
jgi:hypothetical protein